MTSVRARVVARGSRRWFVSPRRGEWRSGDAGIVRNRAKILATIGNAAAFLATAKTFGTFAAYLASVVPPPPARLPPDAVSGAIPATTPASDRVSADLRRRGFRFVGSTIVYAFMQSVGLVDDHLPGCFRYRGSA